MFLGDVEGVVHLTAGEWRNALAHEQERVGVAELLVGLRVRDERVDQLVRVRIVLPHRVVEVVDGLTCVGVSGVLGHLQELVARVVGERAALRGLVQVVDERARRGQRLRVEDHLVGEEAAKALPVDVAVRVLLDEVPRQVRHHLRGRVGRGDAHVLERGLDVVILLEGEPDHLRAARRTGDDLLPQRVAIDVLEPVKATLAVDRVELHARRERVLVVREERDDSRLRELLEEPSQARRLLR